MSLHALLSAFQHCAVLLLDATLHTDMHRIGCTLLYEKGLAQVRWTHFDERLAHPSMLACKKSVACICMQCPQAHLLPKCCCNAFMLMQRPPQSTMARHIRSKRACRCHKLHLHMLLFCVLSSVLCFDAFRCICCTNSCDTSSSLQQHTGIASAGVSYYCSHGIEDKVSGG